MLQATFQKYTLHFKSPGGTSRGVLRTKDSWFIFLRSEDDPFVTGIGECGLLRGLSMDDVPEYEEKLEEVCREINNYSFWLEEGLRQFPSIHFGLEMALKDLETNGTKRLFPSPFTDKEQPISINGLVWMGEKEFMLEQVKSKLKSGFTCIKLKIGAIDFSAELDLLRFIRREFTAREIEIRVDANGAFHFGEALEKLKLLSDFELHSIEQPIQPGQWESMACLCQKSPLAIALDEELIDDFSLAEKEKMLQTIAPQYLIFKPSLIGGFKRTMEWIKLCADRNIPWWITSALESNIGLNALAQWTATLNTSMPQGLGTGQLYTNNIISPLEMYQGNIYYRKNKRWGKLNNSGGF